MRIIFALKLGLYGRTELTSVINFALTISMGEKYDSIGSLAYEPTCKFTCLAANTRLQVVAHSPSR